MSDHYRERTANYTRFYAWHNPRIWTQGTETDGLIHGCRWEGVLPDARVVYFKNYPSSAEVPVRPNEWLVVGDDESVAVLSESQFTHRFEAVAKANG